VSFTANPPADAIELNTPELVVGGASDEPLPPPQADKAATTRQLVAHLMIECFISVLLFFLINDVSEMDRSQACARKIETCQVTRGMIG
jgi:hypothetical protein